MNFAGVTPAKARYDAYLSFTDTYEWSFKDFLKASTIRRVDIPASSGYEYVKRAYGVDARTGRRVRLRNEGSHSGTEGVIVYPGNSTAHIHLIPDGEIYTVHVHPDNIEFLDALEIS